MSDSRHLLALADAFNGVASVVSILAVRRGSGRGWGMAIMWSAFALLSCGLYLRGMERAALPAGNAFELLHALAWGVIAVEALLRMTTQIRLPAAPVAGFAAVLGACAFACPVADGVPSGALGGNPWAGVHVGAVITAFSVFAALALNSVAYLVQHAALSGHRPGVISRVLPSLRQLDRVGVQLLGLGLGLYSFAIAVGIPLFTDSTRTVGATRLKLFLGLCVWIGYASLFAARRFERIGARGAARFAVGLFLVSFFSFWPASLASKRSASGSSTAPTEVRP